MSTTSRILISRSSALRPLKRTQAVPAPRVKQPPTSRSYAKNIHEVAKQSSDTPWLLGAVAVTITGLSYVTASRRKPEPHPKPTKPTKKQDHPEKPSKSPAGPEQKINEGARAGAATTPGPGSPDRTGPVSSQERQQDRSESQEPPKKQGDESPSPETLASPTVTPAAATASARPGATVERPGPTSATTATSDSPDKQQVPTTDTKATTTEPSKPANKESGAKTEQPPAGAKKESK